MPFSRGWAGAGEHAVRGRNRTAGVGLKSSMKSMIETSPLLRPPGGSRGDASHHVRHAQHTRADAPGLPCSWQAACRKLHFHGHAQHT
eukprot:1733312-Prymnesium_polylepis.1